MKTLDTFVASYLETALWSSTDENGTPLDNSKYADAEVSPETLEKMQKDCEEFIRKTDGLFNSLDASVLNSIPNRDRVAHDFWLTRNHHGAGFWDGDYPKELGEQLTAIAHSFGECDLYVGDDGKIYL